MIELGTLFGLRLNARPSALIGWLIMWAILTLLGWLVIGFDILTAIGGGLLATFFHFFSELWHQFGHAIAAHSTGYPMKGITFIWVLGGSRYPSGEGELPARLHLRRAAGGIPASFVLTLIFAGLFLFIHQSGVSGLLWWLTLVLALDNLLVFTLGALLPLGFTDGSTFLEYWPNRNK